MAVTVDIVAMYHRPRAVVARHLAGGVGEDRALVYLMLACFLIFVGQWPRLAREAFLNPDVPLEARLGAALLGWMLIAPLFFYILAGLVRLIGWAVGGKGSGFRVRLAMFWGLLAAAPLWMLHGLGQGFLGQGVEASILGALVLAVTLWFWVQGVRAAETPQDVAPSDGLA